MMNRNYRTLPTIGESDEFGNRIDASTDFSPDDTSSLRRRTEFTLLEANPKLEKFGLAGCIASFAAVIISAVIVVSVVLGVRSSDADLNNIKVCQNVYESWEVSYHPFLNSYVEIVVHYDRLSSNASGANKASLYMFSTLPETTLRNFTARNPKSTAISKLDADIMYYWFNEGTTVNVSICWETPITAKVDLYVLKGLSSYHEWLNGKNLHYIQHVQMQFFPNDPCRSRYATRINSSDEYFFLVLLDPYGSVATANVMVSYDISSVVYDTDNYSPVSKCTADEGQPCSLYVTNYHPVVQIEPNNATNPNVTVLDEGSGCLHVETNLVVGAGFIAFMSFLGVMVLAVAVTVPCCIWCYCRNRRKKRNSGLLGPDQIQ